MCANKILVLSLVVLAGTVAEAQLASPGTEFWSQDSPGIWVDVEASSHFGRTVAAGDSIATDSKTSPSACRSKI